MKLKFRLLTTIATVILVLASCNVSLHNSKVGVIISKVDYGFMSSLLKSIVDARAFVGNGNMEIVQMDSKGNQATQNKQVDELIAQKVAVMAINLIDRNAALDIIGKARTANIPVIFYNLAPFSGDMVYFNKVYFVGSIAEMAGGLQSEMAVDYWKANASMDKNKDGIMQYVVLMGETNHPDARIRTTSLKKLLEMEGIKSQNLGEVDAHWTRTIAKEEMLKLLQSTNDQIEMVFANNDYMALGAIDALREFGYFNNQKFMPVVGVDATPPALLSIENGQLLGTVLNDVQTQGKAIAELAYGLSRGENVWTTSVGPLTHFDGSMAAGGQYILVPYHKVTRDNYREFKRD